MSGAIQLLLAAKPPLVPDPYFELTTLLLPGNGTNGAQNNTFLDGSTNNFTITRNGNTTQGTFSPFSQTGWGNYFDGTGDYLTTPSTSSLSFGTGDFSVEMWVYPTALSGTHNLFVNTSSGDTQFGLFLYTATKVRVATWNTTLLETASGVVAANQWNHIAVTRSGTDAAIFVNGSRAANGTVSTNFSATTAFKIGSATSPGDYFPGYISNLRVVKGTAVYDPTSSTLTVPTAPLTAITNTQLLTCQSNRFIDNSTNAFAITRSGDVSVQAFSPFNPTAAWSAAPYGGSGYFDGSGDYITVANATALQLTSSTAFTLEFWFYANALSAQQHIYMGYNTASPFAGWGFAFGANANPNTTLAFWDGTTWRTVASSLTTGQWYHVAVTSEGTASTGRLYLNGAQQGSAFTVASTINNTAQAIAVGAQNNGSLPFNGYVSNVRMLKGTAAYTGSTYTVPTAPFTNITNTSLLYNFTNAGIYDATSKNDLETVGNAQISTTQSKFGGSSMYFDGTGDYLRLLSNTMFDFGSGDFTIEMWVYRSNSNDGSLFHKSIPSTDTPGNVAIRISSGKIVVQVDSNNSWPADLTLTGATTIATTTWTHVAVTRYGSAFSIYVNGISDATGTYSGTTAITTDPVLIGFWRDVDPIYFTGYINDLRITKGYARYTTGFTPPTAAFPLL